MWGSNIYMYTACFVLLGPRFFSLMDPPPYVLSKVPSHWNFAAGSNVKVWVYGGHCHRVQLLQNGRLLQTKPLVPGSFVDFGNVTYEGGPPSSPFAFSAFFVPVLPHCHVIIIITELRRAYFRTRIAMCWCSLSQAGLRR